MLPFYFSLSIYCQASWQNKPQKPFPSFLSPLKLSNNGTACAPTTIPTKATNDIQIAQFTVALSDFVLSGLYFSFVTQHHLFLPEPLYFYVFHDTFLFYPSSDFCFSSFFWGLLLFWLHVPQVPIPTLYFCSTFTAISLFNTCILTTCKSLTPTLTSLTKCQTDFSIGL